jgi:hypothetical protein
MMIFNEIRYNNINILSVFGLVCRGATIHRGAPKTAILSAKSILDSQQSKFGWVQYKRINCVLLIYFFSSTASVID